MKKKFLNTLAAALLTGAVAVSGLTACSSSDDNIAEETQQPAEAPAYRIVIPATIGNGTTRAVDFDADGSTITSTFKTTDIIYAYNKTQEYFYQQTFKPDADAQSANLGNNDNVAYSYLDNLERWTVGDEIVLMYKLSVKYTTDVTESYYQYDGDYSGYAQSGTASSASAHDFAVATVTVTGKTGTGTSEAPYVVTTSKATFTNLGSMFRQRFTFADADDNAIATPTVTKLIIRDENNKIANTYFPLRVAAEQDNFSKGIYLTNPDLSGDVYWAMRFAEGAGKITFLAYTSDSKVYEGTKDAPASGFANGKYYHSNTPITMKPSTSVIQPTATGTVTYATEWNRLDIFGDAIVSGYSTGWYMNIYNEASGKTLTFDNASFYRTAANSYMAIWATSLTFNLQGDNAYTTLGDGAAISNEGGTPLTLTFTGNGTLALTCTKKLNNTNPGFYNSSSLSVVAASGHTLSHTETQNADGTWTFVYTVRPTE